MNDSTLNIVYTLAAIISAIYAITLWILYPETVSLWKRKIKQYIHFLDYDKQRYFKFQVSSREEDDYDACMYLGIFGICLYMRLPNWLIPPYKVTQRSLDNTYDYTSIYPNIYGMYIYNDGLCIKYGVNETNTMVKGVKDKCIYFTLPFMEWNFIEHRVYNADGTLCRVNTPAKYMETTDTGNGVNKHYFTFKDYDGVENIGSIYTSEFEHSFGTGFFSFLKYFTNNRMTRRAQINFAKETGKRKNDWRGGTLSTSFPVDKCQSTETVFLDYADRNNFSEAEYTLPENHLEWDNLSMEEIGNILFQKMMSFYNPPIPPIPFFKVKPVTVFDKFNNIF